MRGLKVSPIRAAVGAACDHPWLTVLACLILSAAAFWFTAGHFSMTSDTAALISDKVAWRQREIALDKAFPQNSDTTVVVVDGATPELAEAAAASLAAKLEPQTRFFRSVRRPDAGPFFAKEGLLFLSTPEVIATANRPGLRPAVPGAPRRRPEPAGRDERRGRPGRRGDAGCDRFRVGPQALRALADTLQKVAAGRSAFFSWQSMVVGDTASPRRRAALSSPSRSSTTTA